MTLSSNGLKWIMLGGAAVIIVLLNFVSTVPSAQPKVQIDDHHDHGISLEQLVARNKELMAADLQASVKTLQTALQKTTAIAQKALLYDSLMKILGRNGQYAFASQLAEQKATELNGSGTDWMLAGDRYRASAGFEKDPEAVHVLAEASMRCYSKALELEPNNLDAKVGLGMVMVAATSDPMKGITLLREVEVADSTHVNVQLALADFAVQSQQYDKAIERYSKAIRLKPEYYGIRLNLAELYQVKGDTAAAIQQLELYVQKETDPLVRNDVENAIRQLRKK